MPGSCKKTSVQSAKAGPAPALLRITPQTLKVRGGKPRAQHTEASGCPGMIPATIIVTVQHARGRSLQRPSHRRIQPRWLTVSIPVAAAMPTGGYGSPSLPGSFLLSLSCSSQPRRPNPPGKPLHPSNRRTPPSNIIIWAGGAMTSSAPGAIPRTSALVKFFCPSCTLFRPLSCIDMDRRNVYDYILNFVEQFQHITRQICSPIAARP